MAVEYSVEVCNWLKDKFEKLKLHRPMRVGRYDAGTWLNYEITGIGNNEKANVDLEVVKFVGGGFAGQVYKVKILNLESPGIFPLKVGEEYAMKILIPPSGFSSLFRNLVYRIGFQGPFQLQVNPDAARAGALWQKLIRKGAKKRFGSESVVNDIHVTFVDSTLGSCGEISDWVDGRTWRLEVDDHLDVLNKHLKGKEVDENLLSSPEYRAKRKFMHDFVKLLQDMGAYEFARQYEWTTCKSQPNCLKLSACDDDPEKGLTAVDFRAGLALLPFLPMSPGDFKLILKGIGRGSLVQFDRGDLKKLETFMNDNPEYFEDSRHLLEDLKTCEEIYRDSLPDITHNHVRLLYSRKLWSRMFKSTLTGWRIRNITADSSSESLAKSAIGSWLFGFLGIIPFLGGFIRKLWARADWRKHYGHLFRPSYFVRALRGKCAEKAISWHRDGRVTEEQAKRIGSSIVKYLLHLPLSILPIGLHRFFTQWSYLKERLYFIFLRPFRLYFSAPMREEWLLDMLEQGRKKHMLDEEDAKTIQSQVKEPYIQKYLKSLAVHVLTLPVTQVVSAFVAWLYVYMNPQMTTTEATAAVAAILVLFQLTPISPGSLVRGFYVVYLVIKERNFKDYNIAVFLGFFKYIGYLAFPIQMAYRYPELARFMAGHWATEAVHIVPVFGENGALLEHWVFNLFYNWPLTIRRRMRKRVETWKTLKPRYWHVLLYALGAAAILTAADWGYLNYVGVMPTLKNTWWFALGLVYLCGAGVTMGAGGAVLSKRIISAAVWGIMAGIFYTLGVTFLLQTDAIILKDVITSGAWRVFIFAVFGTISAILTELRQPDPTI